MAHFIRSAKSGSDWTENELFAFNIVIQDVDVATFFGFPHFPPTTVSPVILNNALQPDLPISKDDRLFFQYLERANIGEEATVNDFAGHILRMLNFDDEGRLIATKRELSFTMCGTRVWAEADITVMDNAEYSLMMQGGKRTTVTDEPKPQLVAETIAGFVENNRLRAHPLPQQTIPAITMVGPCPIFYKIPVTQALVDALITAQYPAQPTIVQRLVPPVPNPNLYRRHGMNPLENRAIVFQCLEAMRGLLILPRVAAVAAAHGDPDGEYVNFLQAHNSKYKSGRYWLYDQAPALKMSPSRRREKRDDRRPLRWKRQDVNDVEEYPDGDGIIAPSEAQNDTASENRVTFQCPKAFAGQDEVELDNGVFVTCDQDRPFCVLFYQDPHGEGVEG